MKPSLFEVSLFVLLFFLSLGVVTLANRCARQAVVIETQDLNIVSLNRQLFDATNRIEKVKP